LSTSVDDYQLTIAGNGPLNICGDYTGNDINIINKYIPKDQVCELFSRCRALVLPYREATQSGIVPIAYAFKKPVIATVVGGLPEVVKDGQTGFLVQPDRPKQLSDACSRMINDRAIARQMGQNGYRFLKEHMSWTDISDKIISEAYQDES
jgi:glycosyltransferase involved in cell wall biosynthesis